MLGGQRAPATEDPGRDLFLDRTPDLEVPRDPDCLAAGDGHATYLL